MMDASVILSQNAVNIDVLVITLGVRDTLLDVISTLKDFAAARLDVTLRVFVSFNTKPSFGRRIYLNAESTQLPNFTVLEIGPPTYQPTAEHHLLWCLKWYKENRGDVDAFLWPLTDDDSLIEAGFNAVVDFLAENHPDIFYTNSVWGASFGELLPSPAFRTNRLIWNGCASFFFRSVGFEHATSLIGTFFVRSSFITCESIAMFEAAMVRAEICAHTWWALEVSMSTDKFYLLATPLCVHKFNAHNFDDAPTWAEHLNRIKLPSQYEWTVGYLRQLEYFVQQGKMTYKEIRTAMLSEPQRGILPFLDDILRRLFVQAKLALRRPGERFAEADIALIKSVWRGVYPLRMPMIDFLCDVLDKQNKDPLLRLKSYKLAHHWRRVEESQGIFSIIFRNAFYGYYCFEHNVGFVAVLDKNHIHQAYRDLDPVDMTPYILYAPTETELIEKIREARRSAMPDQLLGNFSYYPVELKAAPNPLLLLPNAQLFILSRREGVIRLITKAVQRYKAVLKNVTRLLSVLRV